MLMAEQMVVHEGVALIFEIPHSGLVANPKTNSITAIKIKMISILIVFSENFRYKTAQMTPNMVIEELDAFPSPKEGIQCAIASGNKGPLSITMELMKTKKIKNATSGTNLSPPNKDIVAQAKYAHPINPNIPHQ